MSNWRSVFHRLAKHLYIRIRACDCHCEYICHVAGLISGQAECCQIVRYDIRGAGKICTARCSECQKTWHAGHNLLSIPSRHTEVTHSFCGLCCGELCRCAELSGISSQSLHIIAAGARDGLHFAHGGLKIGRCLNRIYYRNCKGCSRGSNLS